MGGTLYRFAKDLEDDEKMQKAVWAFSDAVAFKVGIPLPKLARNILEGMRQAEEDGTWFSLLVPDPDKRKP
jgi:hypothetical protein